MQAEYSSVLSDFNVKMVELALFRSPFQLELRYRKQWRAGTGFTAAMAERTCCPASVAVAFLYLL
ncbi:hypothetical protein [Janthinobacterium sp. 78]|uniref:hypothetical protein n=1 Tax=Janthinobacterium sp. 78 TaxID=2135631 RepID=UPI001057A5CB|nr:hypothetical protein [Janthinobacterium sp. 78]